MTSEQYRRDVLRRLIRHLKKRRSALTKMRRGVCEFCGLEDVEIDAEHVIPLCLSVPVLERMNAPRMQSEKGNDVLYRTKTVDAMHVKVYAACKLKCNNGWMGQLETASSAFLKPMILYGAETPLNNERRVLLTAWAVKTAMVHEFTDADPTVRYFRRDERIHLKTWLRPPDDVWVWISHSQAARQLSTFPVVAAKRGAVGRVPSLFAFTLLAGQLAIQVFTFRRSEWQDGQVFQLKGGPFENRVLLIWPRADASVILWPPNAAIDEDDVWGFASRFLQRRVRDGDTVTLHDPLR